MKYILSLVAVATLSFYAFAGNFDVQNDAPFSIGTITLHYSDMTSENFGIGSTGTYHLDIGSHTVVSVEVNGSTCNVGTTGGPISIGSNSIYYNFTDGGKFVIDDNIGW